MRGGWRLPNISPAQKWAGPLSLMWASPSADADVTEGPSVGPRLRAHTQLVQSIHPSATWLLYDLDTFFHRLLDLDNLVLVVTRRAVPEFRPRRF